MEGSGMKTGEVLLAALALTISLVVPQSLAPQEATSARETESPAQVPLASAQAVKVSRADKVIGTNVKNPQGETLGEIDNLMIDLEGGRVAFAVLSSGGVLGLGGKLVAVPWHALVLKPGERTFILNMDKEKLQNAPSFEKNSWPELTDRQWLSEVYTYYGNQPYWESR
jgi:sporulation protein YlmC with PRC-barrel domain